MDVSDYIGFVAAEGDRFATAAEGGELSVRIAPCPGWDMGDLVRHLGMIHLWAAANVAFPESDWLDVDELPDLVRYWPELAGGGVYPNDAELVTWYRETLANLVEVLKSAPSDVAAFTFLPAATPLTMWSRRQASEIAIHRFDAEQARGVTTRFDPAFASDMLDELLTGFAPRSRANRLDIERSQVVHVHAADTDDHWFVRIDADGIETSREGESADLTLTASAADLYVQLWNRTPDSGIAMSGDTDLVDLWSKSVRVRWG